MNDGAPGGTELKTMNKELRALSALNCRPGAPILPVSELMLRLHALPGWDYADNRISKTFRFANYYETIGFVNVIAYLANRQDHHPDLSVHYNRVVVSFATHDVGGVTLNDCICAAKIEELSA
jgi:4a-hydroxytetrahydrobiopterin dehydratase